MSPKQKALLAAAAKVAPAALRDVAGLGGLLMAVHGVSLIYPPAAWIIGGLLVAGYAFVSAGQRR